MGKDGVTVRRERIHQVTKRVLSLLAKNDGEISLSKTLVLLEYEIGLTREKLLEYIRIGAETEHFDTDLENDRIRTVTEK